MVREKHLTALVEGIATTNDLKILQFRSLHLIHRRKFYPSLAILWFGLIIFEVFICFKMR